MSIRLTSQAFDELFPFHVAVGRDGWIRHIGNSLSRLCPAVKPGVPFRDVFVFCRPDRPFDFQELESSPRTVYLLQETATGIRLRGQMFSLRPAQELIVFLGSPWLSDLVDIEAWGLSVHGYASHDAAVDLFQVLQLHKVAMNDLKALTQKLKSQRTSLRQANVSLKRQEAESRKLALIAARTDNAVILSDAQGRIEWVNEGFTRLTGYLLEEV